MHTVEIIGAEGADNRVLRARYAHTPLVLSLDSSATMKLLGNRIGDFQPTEPKIAASISAAAQRIIDGEGGIPPKIVITALDLD